MNPRTFITFLFCLCIVLFPLHLLAADEGIIGSLKKFEESNRTLLLTDDRQEIDPVIKEQDVLLETIMESVKKYSDTPLDFSTYSKSLKFLETRISINQSRGNTLAVARDKTARITDRIHIRLVKFISFLIQARNTYAPQKKIISEAQKELDWLEALTVPNVPEFIPGQVYEDLKKNNFEYRVTAATYTGILDHVMDNPEDIASVSWLSYFRMGTFITAINDCCTPVRSFNRIMRPINLNAGKIVVALFLFVLVCFLPIVLDKFERLTRNFIEKYDFSSSTIEIFYNKIHTPLRLLVLVFGINMVLLVLLYGTALEEYILIISFIIYSGLFIYLAFNLIDVTAIIKLDQIKNSDNLLREEFINLFIRLAKFAALLLVISTGLGHYGIKMTAILSTLGLGGLAFALAAKDTLSNFFGGITILMDDVFRQGDWIKLQEVEGTVIELGIRSTTIRSFANALITVPNSVIANQYVINWNRREVGRRIKLTIGVTYECRMVDLKKAIEDIRQMLKKHPGIAQPAIGGSSYRKETAKLVSQKGFEGIQNTQLVYFDRYGDFSLDIIIYCYSKTTDWAEWLAVKEDVLYRLHEIITKNNLSFAYPTQVRITKNIDEPEENFPDESLAT